MKHLPLNERFEIYFDEDGDYSIDAIERHANGVHLAAHGKTPNKAIRMMRKVLATLAEMEEAK